MTSNNLDRPVHDVGLCYICETMVAQGSCTDYDGGLDPDGWPVHIVCARDNGRPAPAPHWLDVPIMSAAERNGLARNTLRLRRTQYRGLDGWSITGRRAGTNRGVDIFFEHWSAAQRTIKRMREDPRYDVTLADFEP